MPVRIYEISKKLGIENKEVLAKAKELGITAARVPSSSLDKITAEFLESHLKPAAPVAPPPPPPPPAPVIITAPPVEEPVTPVAVEPEPPSPPEEPVIATPERAEVVEAKVPPPVEQPPVPPPPPPMPAGPKVGDKVGFIQLPTKPAPRAPEKPAGGARPVQRPGMPARGPEPQRGGRPGDGRGMRPGQQGMQQGRPGFGQQARPGAAPAGRTEPAAPKFVPPTTGEVITLKPPIIVRDLAEQLKRRPFQLIADLIELK